MPEGRGALRERLRDGPPGSYVHEAWEGRFPGLACGITSRAAGDFGLSTTPGVTGFLDAWVGLARGLGFPAVTLPRQVHGAAILEVGGDREVVPAAPGGGGEDAGAERRPATVAVSVAGEADGLVTGAGRLLGLTAADCVPIFAVHPERRVAGLFHAGWRGTAAGVLEAGLAALEETNGVPPAELHLHLGPAICGTCYEVGPEVMQALGGAPRRGTLDLREELAERALRAGVAADRIGRSGWCTRCAADRFHSHRGSGEKAGRMAAYVGWRAADPPVA